MKKDSLTELTAVAQPADGGSVSGGGRYAPSTVVEVQALPAEGYRFSRWVGNVTNRTAPVTKTYIGSRSQQVVAVFEPKRHLVDVKVMPSNAGAVDGAGYQPIGTQSPVYAQPAPGYLFDRWEGPVSDPTSANTTLARPLNRDVVLTAHFKPLDETYTITVLAEPATAGGVSGGGTYKRGETVTIKAEPKGGFLFNGWSGPVTSKGRAETTVYVTENAIVTAKFMLNRSLVRGKASPDGAGRVEGSFGAMPVGEPIPIRAVAMPGFAFVRWDGPVADRTKTQTTITPTAGKASVVTAIFEQIR
ncbi:hypothetical protein CKA38_03680 [Ereboglobus luteus]|uniref:Bacterial repeat domain-containing protein n=1 Tax=Ereboglobus luteus TaxID=1796921 RepID=A0A2U8E0U6_9BACT|nr:hypothetical protein CKA38_03680 [Ereboglobus luteus]